MTMMSPKTPTPLDSIWIYKPGGGGDYHSPQLHPKDIEYIRADIVDALRDELAALQPKNHEALTEEQKNKYSMELLKAAEKAPPVSGAMEGVSSGMGEAIDWNICLRP